MSPRRPRAAARRLAPAAALLALGAATATACATSSQASPPAAPRQAPPITPGMPVAAADTLAAVRPGVEVLLADSLHLLRGKRVGLITNHSGRDRAGRSTIDLLHAAPGVQLVALFSPEHGIRGAAEAGVQVESGRDARTGLPVHSLYGATRVPTDEMLRDVDVLVYDIQDAGARVYTYVWTMALAAEAAGKRGIEFVVLDRPDPIRADRVEGGVLEPGWRSFVGQYPVALRYGLTPGELLRHLVASGQVAADVTVVPMRGYRRDQWYDETGLPWVNPSPNLRSLDAMVLYPGTVLVEATNLSEGRGTDAPFQLVGAPWLDDAEAIAAELNARALPGVRFTSTVRPVAMGQKWGGRTIPMLRLDVTDRDAVEPVAVGLHLLQAIAARHADDLEWRDEWLARLTGTARTRQAVASVAGVEALLAAWRAESARFAGATAGARLY